MWNRLTDIWSGFRRSPIFLVTALAVGGVLLATLITYLDLHIAVFSGPSSAKEAFRFLFLAVATALIVVTGITLATSLLVFHLSQQRMYPARSEAFRWLDNGRWAIGLLLASIAFNLIALILMPAGDENARLPVLAALSGSVLTITSIILLVRFFQLLAIKLRVQDITASYGQAFAEVIARDFPPLQPAAPGRSPSSLADVTLDALPKDFEQNHFQFLAPQSGYVSSIDFPRLLRLAMESNLVIRVPKRPSSFVSQGEVIAELYPGSRSQVGLAKLAASAIDITPDQDRREDVEFRLQLLVAQAVRSLSPVTRDLVAAAPAIDWLCAGLEKLSMREFPPATLCDQHGVLRLMILSPLTYGQVLEQAFTPLRHTIGDAVIIRLKLLDSLARMAKLVNDHDRLAQLARHARLIMRYQPEDVPEEEDRALLEERYQRMLAVVKSQWEGQAIREAH